MVLGGSYTLGASASSVGEEESAKEKIEGAQRQGSLTA
jgi:hypothetical protein